MVIQAPSTNLAARITISAMQVATAPIAFTIIRVEPPRPRLEAVRIVDMSASNSWAEFAATFRRTRPAYQEHEGAKADLKKLVPEDAREATGHGLRAKRSKSGAISFDLLDLEAGHAALQ